MLTELEVKTRLRRLRKEIQDCDNLKRDLLVLITSLQKHCPHNWSFYSDPSGNNDSGYTCSICDKDVKSIKNV